MSVKAITWAWTVNVQPTEKLLLVALADHANDEDYTCWPSLTHLEKKTGMSRTTVWRGIDRLVSAGLIARIGEHGSGATLYRVDVGAQCTQVQSEPRCTDYLGAQRNTGRCTVKHEVGAQRTPNRHMNRKEPSGRFTPPTVEEVRAYCQERGNNVDPVTFVDHYTTNGWMRGKNKIKDWKACVRTWERNEPKQPKYAEGAI